MEIQQNSIKDFLTKNYFLYCFYVFLLLGLFPLLLCSKPYLNIWVNNHIANYGLDPIMIYYSQIFEWWCILIGAVYLLFVSRRKVLLLIIIGLLCGIVTMLLKDYIVGNIPRPTKLLPLQSYKHILKDVDVYKENYSFPSGHTMLAFSMMSLLASFSKKKIWTIVFFVIALTAGFSRIYLLQHFLVDVYVGACIGVMLTLVVIYFSNKYLRVPDTPFIQKEVRNC